MGYPPISPVLVNERGFMSSGTDLLLIPILRNPALDKCTGYTLWGAVQPHKYSKYVPILGSVLQTGMWTACFSENHCVLQALTETLRFSQHASACFSFSAVIVI